MIKTFRPTLILTLACPLLALSCATPSNTGDTYSRHEAGRAQSVKEGQITSIQNVTIEGGTTAGSIIGAGAGAVAGHRIGSGSTANTLGSIGGGLAGSAIGSRVQKSAGSKAGLNIVVNLDSGGSISVVQEVNAREHFRVGDRVKVIYNGSRTRVTR